jgi:hypothetical protein
LSLFAAKTCFALSSQPNLSEPDFPLHVSRTRRFIRLCVCVPGVVFCYFVFSAPRVRCTMWPVAHVLKPVVRVTHGLIKYIDTKAKCRHLKNLSVKGLAASVYQSL